MLLHTQVEVPSAVTAGIAGPDGFASSAEAFGKHLMQAYAQVAEVFKHTHKPVTAPLGRVERRTGLHEIHIK